MNKLTKYNNKRNFNITSEPIGKIFKKNKKVVDKSDCVGYNIHVGSVSESLS